MGILMDKSWELNAILTAFESNKITLAEIISTFDEARRTAETYDRNGNSRGPDHATRVRAAQGLLGLIGLPSKSKVPDMKPTDFSKLLEDK